MSGETRVVAEGERVLLRTPVEADREAYIEARRSSRTEHEPWEPIFGEDFDAFGDDVFDRDVSRCWTETDRRLLAVRRDDGAIVGRVGASSIERGPFQNCRLGWWGTSADSGRGYMTEAVQLAIRSLFEGESLHRIEANILPTNARSVALARR